MQQDNLEDLEKKLTAFEEKSPSINIKPKESNQGALFIAAEIIAGISIGTLIGYNLDQYLHTKVLFLLIFVILGLISSLYNIYKKYK
jgi:ATP synthase protein I